MISKMNSVNISFLLVLCLCILYRNIYALQWDETEFKKTKINSGIPAILENELSRLNEKSYSHAVIGIKEICDTVYLLIHNDINEPNRFWLFYFSDDNKLVNELLKYEDKRQIHQKLITELSLLEKKISLELIIENNNDSLFYKYAFIQPISIKWRANFIFESFCLFTEGYDYKKNGMEKGFKYFPLSFYFNGGLVFDDFTLEIRPGILLGGDYFWGLEIGSFIRKDFTEDLFASIGLLGHFNTGMSHGTMVYEQIDSKVYYNIGIGIGIKITGSIYFLISYYKTLNEYYGYNFVTWDNKNYERKLFSIIKFGFEFGR